MLEPLPCRLCHGRTNFAFSLQILRQYAVAFLRCDKCLSLQSETPFWLQEAYSKSTASIDPGAARRILNSYVLTRILAKLFHCQRLFDFGAGTGLMCRLLRDQRYDAYCYDRYVTPTFAPHFVGSLTEQYDLVSAFEVIEHFIDPAQELQRLFSLRPKVLLISTELYSNQDRSWWYLAPMEGQHIFFYSITALKLVAQQYGYHLLVGRGFCIFSAARPGPLKRAIVRILRPAALRLLSGLMLASPGKGADLDYSALTTDQRSS